MPDCTEAANAKAFAQPHWRVIAQGFDTERWFDDGQAVGTGGILNPQPTRLPAGHFYYRFASTSSPAAAQFGSGWWLDFENFRLVQSVADENGYRLRDAARLLLALPYAFSRVDLLVRALLTQPLRAWTGTGKPAQGATDGADRGTRWIPAQFRPARQLYIPGLMVRGAKAPLHTPLHTQVFAQPPERTPLR